MASQLHPALTLAWTTVTHWSSSPYALLKSLMAAETPPSQMAKNGKNNNKLVREKQIGGTDRCPICLWEHGGHHTSA